MSHSSTVDLTEKCNTFPDFPSAQIIPVDAKIRELRRKLNGENPIVILVGPTGSGKTNQLMQFAKHHSSQVFSYFLSNNYWTWRQTSFLSSLCTQMREALGITSINQKDSFDETIASVEQLKVMFENLNQRIIEDLVKRKKQTFYFVIDGLEWAYQGNNSERIIDLLPPITNSRGLYFLGSLNKSNGYKLPFNYLEEEPQYFSLVETEKYLSGIKATHNEIQKMQDISGGMPGILYLVKKICKENGEGISQIVEKSGEFDTLAELQWKKSLQDFSEEKKSILALLAFSLIPIKEAFIADLLELPKEEVRNVILETGIIYQSKDGKYYFYPEIHKTYSQNKLHHLRKSSLEMLSRYYENHPTDPEANHLLPEYYRLTENYGALQNLLAPSYITSVIVENKDFNLAQRDLNSAIELAKRAKDISVIKFGLAKSQMKTLSNELIGSSEIYALIALKKFDQALELAYSIRLTTTRIRLLAAIYSAMEKEGITVPRQSLIEIQKMVDALNINEIEPEDLVIIASDLFPLLPDLATSLVEKVKDKENERNPLELFLLMTSVKSEGPESEDLITKIENRDIQEFAMVNSPWLSKLSASQVISKAEQVQNIKAKIYLFQIWCLRNRENPEVHLAMEAALDAINREEYKIPLRILRQISEPLKSCKLEHRSLLIKRFEIPELFSLKSPVEERVRLELNFAEAIDAIDAEEARNRFCETYSTIKSMPLDTDVACYCYTRLLISLNKLNIANKQNLIFEIKKKLEDEFLLLLETSADQFEISERILKALPLFDPILALSFAEMLNTVSRRDHGIQEVLLSCIKRDHEKVTDLLLSDGLSRIYDDRTREQTILRLIDTAREFNRFENSMIKNFCFKAIDQVTDPIVLCKSIAYVLSKMKYENNPQEFKELFSYLINAWEKIDVIWMRVEAAFDLVSVVAEGGTSCAEDLYDLGKALRNSSPLATQTIGSMFFRILVLASRAVGKLNLSNQSSIETWERFLKSIDHVPSSLLRSLLYAQVALQRLKSGDKTRFDSLVLDHVISELQTLPSSDLKNKIVSDLAICIFEYSPSEASRWIEKLSYALRNRTWGQIGVRILTNSCLFDEIDTDSPNLQLDIARANKVLNILGNIDRDHDFNLVGTLFARAIAESSKLAEAAKIDFLTKLEDLVNSKLPDNLNIQHNGYKVLLASQIEVALRTSAKKTKAQIRKKHPQIISEARKIRNISDSVLVMADVAENFRDKEREIAEKLMNEAFMLTNQIPNSKDRANRLQLIAEGFSKLHKTDESYEAIKIAKNLALTLEGHDRDSVLAAVIQTAHQIDKEFGEQITEKIEDMTVQYNLDSMIKANDLAKAPHKLVAGSSEDSEVLKIAASKMLRSINSGRSISYSKNTIMEWLYVTKNLDFDATNEIIEWAIEASLRQETDAVANDLASQIINSLIVNCHILTEIGSNISSLSVIPENLKFGFQGLSTQKKLFKVGDRVKAIEFISLWLKTNAQESVKICDPYFDKEQLWILKDIPVEIEVKIICTANKFGIHPKQDDLLSTPMEARERQKKEKRKLKEILNQAWADVSDQTPPPTLFVIHGTVYDSVSEDDFHDRYIITKNAGISLGTSLNGFGNKEFFITMLSQDDVKYVEENYFYPKLNIQEIFSKVIYFELEE